MVNELTKKVLNPRALAQAYLFGKTAQQSEVVISSNQMLGNFFSAAAAILLEPSAFELPHWLIVAGAVLVIVGTIGVLVCSRQASVRQQPEREIGSAPHRPRRTSDALPPPSFTD